MTLICQIEAAGYYLSDQLNSLPVKVENILEDSLDSIASPSLSVKIQIMGGKVYLR